MTVSVVLVRPPAPSHLYLMMQILAELPYEACVLPLSSEASLGQEVRDAVPGLEVLRYEGDDEWVTGLNRAVEGLSSEWVLFWDPNVLPLDLDVEAFLTGVAQTESVALAMDYRLNSGETVQINGLDFRGWGICPQVGSFVGEKGVFGLYLSGFLCRMDAFKAVEGFDRRFSDSVFLGVDFVARLQKRGGHVGVLSDWVCEIEETGTDLDGMSDFESQQYLKGCILFFWRHASGGWEWVVYALVTFLGLLTFRVRRFRALGRAVVGALFFSKRCLAPFL